MTANNHFPNTTILEYLTKLAMNNEGVKGKWKLAAGIVLKNNLIATGVNSYKTHPMMAKYGKNSEAIFLHAEILCVKNALKMVEVSDLSRCSIYVVRVKKDSSYGNSMPCLGCQRAIEEFNFKSVVYFSEECGWVVNERS